MYTVHTSLVSPEAIPASYQYQTGMEYDLRYYHLYRLTANPELQKPRNPHSSVAVYNSLSKIQSRPIALTTIYSLSKIQSRPIALTTHFDIWCKFPHPPYNAQNEMPFNLGKKQHQTFQFLSFISFLSYAFLLKNPFFLGLFSFYTLTLAHGRKKAQHSCNPRLFHGHQTCDYKHLVIAATCRKWTMCCIGDDVFFIMERGSLKSKMMWSYEKQGDLWNNTLCCVFQI